MKKLRLLIPLAVFLVLVVFLYVGLFRDPREIDGRSVGTAIYYLLPAGQVSQWHRVDAGEIWHWHAGAPLEL